MGALTAFVNRFHRLTPKLVSLRNSRTITSLGFVIVGLGQVIALSIGPEYFVLGLTLIGVVMVLFGSGATYNGASWKWHTPITWLSQVAIIAFIWFGPAFFLATQVISLGSRKKLFLLLLLAIVSVLTQLVIGQRLFRIFPVSAVLPVTSAITISGLIITGTQFYALFIEPKRHIDNLISEDCAGAGAFLNDCSDALTQELRVSPQDVAAELDADRFEYQDCLLNTKSAANLSEPVPCQLGVSAEQAEMTIAVIGDSHGRVWLPMFDELGQRNNWQVLGFVRGGCTPIDVGAANLPASNTKPAKCQKFMHNATRVIAEDPDVDIVFQAASRAVRKDNDGSNRSPEGIFTEHAESMWSQWQEAHKKVVIISELPHFNVLNMPECIENNGADSAIEECALPRERALQRPANFYMASQSTDLEV